MKLTEKVTKMYELDLDHKLVEVAMKQAQSGIYTKYDSLEKLVEALLKEYLQPKVWA